MTPMPATNFVMNRNDLGRGHTLFARHTDSRCVSRREVGQVVAGDEDTCIGALLAGSGTVIMLRYSGRIDQQPRVMQKSQTQQQHELHA